MMKQLKMKRNYTPGMLITFCGLDGCGKTTLMHRLISELEKSASLCVTKQPTDLVRQSGIFRTYMDCPNHDAYDYRSLSLLAASDRLQHAHQVIEPAMRQGKIVLSDRYFYSCLANLRARGFQQDEWIYEISQCILQPDIAFFFDVSVETAMARVRSREAERERYIDVALQHRLREEYRQICAANDGVLIPTGIPVEESYAMVTAEIERVKNRNESQRKNS